MALVSGPSCRQCQATTGGNTRLWVAWWPWEQGWWCSHLGQVFAALAKWHIPSKGLPPGNIFKGKYAKVVLKMLPPDFPTPASPSQGRALADVPGTSLFAREIPLLHSCSEPPSSVIKDQPHKWSL